MATETKTLTPPYLSVPQFKNFIKQLADTAVPIKIDKGVIGSLSGSSQAALNSALRFLRLVDSDGASQQALRSLVGAYKESPEAWKAALGELIADSYLEIVGSVDLDGGTWQTLEKAFITAGVREGQMSAKVTRFYVAAQEEAGVKLSHYITNAKVRSSSGTPRPPRKAKPGNASLVELAENEPRADTERAPEGYIDQPVPLPGRARPAVIRFPRDITEAEYAFLAHAVAGVKLYADAQKGRAG